MKSPLEGLPCESTQVASLIKSKNKDGNDSRFRLLMNNLAMIRFASKILMIPKKIVYLPLEAGKLVVWMLAFGAPDTGAIWTLILHPLTSLPLDQVLANLATAGS